MTGSTSSSYTKFTIQFFQPVKKPLEEFLKSTQSVAYFLKPTPESIKSVINQLDQNDAFEQSPSYEDLINYQNSWHYSQVMHKFLLSVLNNFKDILNGNYSVLEQDDQIQKFLIDENLNGKRVEFEVIEKEKKVYTQVIHPKNPVTRFQIFKKKLENFLIAAKPALLFILIFLLTEIIALIIISKLILI